jgi:hypothetical protein
MYLKEIQLLMARAYGPGSYDPLYESKGIDYPLPYVRWTENRNMEEFLRLLGAGRVHVKPLVTHVLPLDRAPEAYATIMQPGVDEPRRAARVSGQQIGRSCRGLQAGTARRYPTRVEAKGLDRVRLGGRRATWRVGSTCRI